MSTKTKVTQGDTFTIGWIVLLSISVLSTFWLIILMFTFVDEAPFFMGWRLSACTPASYFIFHSGAARNGRGTQPGFK